MTVAELIEKLKEIPQDYPLHLKCSECYKKRGEVERIGTVIQSDSGFLRNAKNFPIVMLSNSNKDLFKKDITKEL